MFLEQHFSRFLDVMYENVKKSESVFTLEVKLRSRISTIFNQATGEKAKKKRSRASNLINVVTRKLGKLCVNFLLTKTSFIKAFLPGPKHQKHICSIGHM